MKKAIESPIFFVLLAAIFFLPFLGGVHLFDWDEINFAEIAREMTVLNNYLEVYINYEVFTEKPPLFMWLQAISMNVFGVGDYAARFPNAVFGILVLPLLYTLGKKMHSKKFGVYWALAWFGSILPHLYFKSGIIDPVFNFFIFLAIYFLIRYQWDRNGYNARSRTKHVWLFLTLAGVSTGLAMLTKGPVAFLIISLTLGVYWIWQRFKWFISVPHFIYFTTISLLVVLVWVGLNYVEHGPKFILEFTIRQWTMLTTPDAGHGGFLGYHFVVLLVGCFPASIFAIQAMLKKDHSASTSQLDFRRWMLILFWVVLILFSIVTTKIVHYSSMAYYPLTYLAAVSLMNIDKGKWKFTIFMKVGLWIIGGIAALITIALPFIGMNIQKLKFLFEQDAFALQNIEAKINWTGFESLAGIFLLAILLFSLLSKRSDYALRFRTLFLGMGVWVMLTLIFDIGKIEAISQRAAVEFWEKHAGEDCYVTTFGYKSYAHLYYARVSPQIANEQNHVNGNTAWLLLGKVDKPVYISCKVTSYEQFESEIKDAQFLYSKNGFYFYKRVPKKKSSNESLEDFLTEESLI